MEQLEKSWDETKGDVEEVDHNILAVLPGDNQNVVSDELKTRLTDFVLHVFDHIRPNKNRVGNFLNKQEALEYIESCKDV